MGMNDISLQNLTIKLTKKQLKNGTANMKMVIK